MTVKKLTAALLAVFTVTICLPFAAAESSGNISWEVKDKTLVISPMTDTAATFQRKKFRQDLPPGKNMLSDRKSRRQGKHILTI